MYLHPAPPPVDLTNPVSLFLLLPHTLPHSFVLGDHEVVVCDVVSWRPTAEEAAEAGGQHSQLYTGFLRKEGYL